MREILFRAKAIKRDSGYHRTNYKNGDWVYGLITRPYKDMLPTLSMEMRNTNGVDGIEVDYKTVGQFTGLTDKNGTKIFEGDIVEYENGERAVIRYNEYVSAYIADFGGGDWDYLDIENGTGKVIGNIHDNHELLKEIQNG